MEPGAVLEVRLLGRFAVLRDGAEIPSADFGGRKVTTLLRALVVRRPAFVPHDALAAQLWPGRQPSDPAANLQVLVNRARKATGSPALIRTGPGGYAFTADEAVVIDAEVFLAGARAASALDGSAALAAYEAALEVYAGEPLAEDRYDDWAAPYREQVQRVRAQVLEDAAALALRLGFAGRAVDLAGAAVAEEPLREAGVLTLVRALATTGDVPGGLAQYERYRRLLADELGLDPSDEGRAVQAQLLAGGGRGVSPAPAPGRHDPEPLRFVGRQSELDAALRVLRDGPFHVVLAGLSGAGKSRLAQEIAAALPSVTVRAYWPERAEPFAVARALLRELLALDHLVVATLPSALRGAVASLLPEIEGADELEPSSRRSLLVEAVVRIASAASVALVVDDLQWADPTSVELLATLVARVPGLPVVLACRSDEVVPGDHVDQLLRRLEATWVTVSALSAGALDELVADAGVASAVLAHTDGTPLAVSELLLELEREGLITRDRRGSWHVNGGEVVPRVAEVGELGQRRAIGRRVARHTGLQEDLLGLIAVLAREVPVRTLASALDVEQRIVLDGLAALASAGLVRFSDQGWTTSHDMVGEVVADQMDPATATRLQALLARAVEADDGDPAELARLWLGAADARKAAGSFLRAAGSALDGAADDEAAALAESGLAVAEAGTPVQGSLLVVRAETRRRRGNLLGAREDLRGALEVHHDGPARAEVLTRLALLASGSDDLVRAAQLVELAVLEAGHHPAARARALEVASVLDMNLGRPERAANRAGEALAIFEALGDSRAAARILDARAMASFLDGDITGGTEQLERVANLFEDSGDLARLVTPRSTQGHGLVFLDRPSEGLVAASAALEAARSLGHPESQAYALWHRSEALSALGRTAEALADGQEARATATRIGHRGWLATAWRAIGIAHETAGDLMPALEAYSCSLEASANLDLFGCWAAARSAMTLVRLGRVPEAEPLVRRALSLGPPLGGYEARRAQLGLALAAGDDVDQLASKAMSSALAGGAHREVRLLQALVAG